MVRVETRTFTRVEGSGSADIIIEDGKVKEVKVRLVEGPRFFELLTLGRDYYDVPDMEARICAICYLSHSIASITAIERAFEVEVTEEIELLRELGLLGELIESHSLHLYLLVSPDVFGQPDAINLAKKHWDLVKDGVTIMNFGNYIRNLIGGREIHGINAKPGGFGRYPSEEELRVIEKNFKEYVRNVVKILELFASQRPFGARFDVNIVTDKYLLGDKLMTDDGSLFDYHECIEEKALPYSFAKQSRYKGKIFMVGSLPRLLLKSKYLTPTAAEFFEGYKDLLMERYVSRNNLAQAIELIYALEKSGEIAERLLDEGISGNNVPIRPVEGEGIGYVEAPRGVLVHHYRIGEDGKIKYSNIITPTAMNHALMELSLYEEAKNNLGRMEDERVMRRLEETIRAFDPCISCSVHMVKMRS
jgi:sulfhydrogenase subunit alpha